MHRKTKDYLDEISFWHCARSRLLHRAAQLRHNPEAPVQQTPAQRPREPLDDLLQKCGLGELCRCPGHAADNLPGYPLDPSD